MGMAPGQLSLRDFIQRAAVRGQYRSLMRAAHRLRRRDPTMVQACPAFPLATSPSLALLAIECATPPPASRLLVVQGAEVVGRIRDEFQTQRSVTDRTQVGRMLNLSQSCCLTSRLTCPPPAPALRGQPKVRQAMAYGRRQLALLESLADPGLGHHTAGPEDDPGTASQGPVVWPWQTQ